MVALLYYLYHFEYEVKKRGSKVIHFKVDEWYINLMKEFQMHMRYKVAKVGIAVECNPTSNVLISTFEDYDQHPILTFNQFYLEDNLREVNLQATINTDDIGVFDTSLENEYALLLSAICRKRHREQNYNDDAVYAYLDYLRENGIRVSFKNKQLKHNSIKVNRSIKINIKKKLMR